MKTMFDPENPRYVIDFDLSTQKMYVYMGPGILHEQVAAKDGESKVDVQFGADHLPCVFGVEINNPNKFTIIQDWIEEAIEAAVASWNHTGTDFDDNHWKGDAVG